MNPKRGSKTQDIALSGLLFALAMALSFVEGTLVIPGLMPGMKLGLANIVVMYALFFMGGKQALMLDLLKALFVFLVSGWTAGFLSLCGGLFSLLVMWVLYDHFPVQRTGSSSRSAVRWPIMSASCWGPVLSSPRPCRSITHPSCWYSASSWARSHPSPCGPCCPPWAAWATTPAKSAVERAPVASGAAFRYNTIYKCYPTRKLPSR